MGAGGAPVAPPVIVAEQPDNVMNAEMNINDDDNEQKEEPNIILENELNDARLRAAQAAIHRNLGRNESNQNQESNSNEEKEELEEKSNHINDISNHPLSISDSESISSASSI